MANYVVGFFTGDRYYIVYLGDLHESFEECPSVYKHRSLAEGCQTGFFDCPRWTYILSRLILFVTAGEHWMMKTFRNSNASFVSRDFDLIFSIYLFFVVAFAHYSKRMYSTITNKYVFVKTSN